MTKTILWINSIRLFPHILAFLFSKNKSIIEADNKRWKEKNSVAYDGLICLLFLLTFHKEYRNLFYHRIGHAQHLLKLLAPKESTLFLHTKHIGEGFYIQHGFSTIIVAKSIGKNCSINQQVTVGWTKRGCPTILDNVSITAGAKVLGGVTIGNNSNVGANAVVLKDVPNDCVVVGVPAYIVSRAGIKVREDLK